MNLYTVMLKNKTSDITEKNIIKYKYMVEF